MKKENFLKAIQKLKASAKKRNFVQTYDLIITLKDLDLKKPENQVNLFVQLKYPRKKVKVCAFVAPDLFEEAKKYFDKVILVDEFDKYKDVKMQKAMTKEFDFFVAQATVMPKVATIFGKVLGRRGKMPNPKAGCVIAPGVNLKALYEKLQRLVHISIKDAMMAQVAIGNEKMADEEVAENGLAVYEALVHALQNGERNIKKVLLKFTMSKPVEVEKGD